MKRLIALPAVIGVLAFAAPAAQADVTPPPSATISCSFGTTQFVITPSTFSFLPAVQATQLFNRLVGLVQAFPNGPCRASSPSAT